MALVRLQGELAELESKWQEQEQHFAKQGAEKDEAASGRVAGCLILFIALVVLVAVGTLAAGEKKGAIILVPAALLLALLIGARISARRTTKRLEAEHQAKWQVFHEQMESTKSQIAKQRQIVDA